MDSITRIAGRFDCIGIFGLDSFITFKSYWDRSWTWVGSEKETSSLIRDLCSFFDGPILLDADAIRPEILKELRNQDRIVLTPHAGEFLRISNKKDADQWIAGNDCTLILKGPHTRILTRSTSIFCPGGSSVLARGGSGDILTGILGALLAKKKYHSGAMLSCGSMARTQWLRHLPGSMVKNRYEPRKY